MAVLLSGFMVVVLLTAFQNTIAANASNTVINATNLNLGSSFYIEKDKTTSVTLSLSTGSMPRDTFKIDSIACVTMSHRA
jgi:shikimate kinase